jgi:hypothetical protein
MNTSTPCGSRCPPAATDYVDDHRKRVAVDRCVKDDPRFDILQLNCDRAADCVRR